MPRFVIVEADYPCGRGARGRNLYRFLSVFHGSQSVRLVTTRQLLQGERIQSDVLFIGMPTLLTEQHLARVQYRQAVLFDYQDGAGPCWMNSDREFLRSLTDLYLKPWVEPHWNYGMRMGLLPIRRHRKLEVCLRLQEALSCWGNPSWLQRLYDVAFIGNATAMENRFHQRVQWMREIKNAAGQVSFWGGLATGDARRRELQRQFTDFAELCYPGGRVNFLCYFRHLNQARVALAPAGNARWSYRHYEAIYAGALVVSTDFRHVETLIPLPKTTMIHVPDDSPVLPAVEKALELRQEMPDVIFENVRFLEQYLHYGNYARCKPALMDHFMAQLAS